MFRGPQFIVSTMQAGTTPIFKVFGMTEPSSNRESNPLRQCWVPSIVAFYDQQEILRTNLSPGSSIRGSHPLQPSNMEAQGACLHCLGKFPKRKNHRGELKWAVSTKLKKTNLTTLEALQKFFKLFNAIVSSGSVLQYGKCSEKRSVPDPPPVRWESPSDVQSVPLHLC